MHLSLKDDCQVVAKRDASAGLTRSSSDGQLDSLRKAMLEGFHTVHFDEPITSSSGDETDAYVPSLHPSDGKFSLRFLTYTYGRRRWRQLMQLALFTSVVPVFLQNIDSQKEIDARNLNVDMEPSSKTSKELIFCSKLAEKPYEESSL